MTLSKVNWQSPVARIGSKTVLEEKLENEYGRFEVAVLKDLDLTLQAGLFLLGGRTLTQLFDGTLLLSHIAAWKELPFMLVAATSPSLRLPPPVIDQVVLVRVLNLKNENIVLAELRGHLFREVVDRGIFSPGVSTGL